MNNVHRNKLITTDPKVFGPGMWMTFHIMSFNANTLTQSNNFLHLLKPIIEKLPCKECRIHALEFIRKTNYNKYKNMRNNEGLYLGPFIYICDMHNNANKLLKKGVISWEKVYSVYNNMELLCTDGPCTDDNHYDFHDNGVNMEQIKSNIMESVEPKPNPKLKINRVVFTKNGKII